MRNIVFYSKSKGDQHSPRLFSIMKVLPKEIQSNFIYYCIDPDPVTKKRNDDVLQLMGISEVPTMYVNGEKYVGKDAFDWLLMQYNHLQTVGEPTQRTSNNMYEEAYHPQYSQNSNTSYDMGQYGQQLPGVPQMPQMGGFSDIGRRSSSNMGRMNNVGGRMPINMNENMLSNVNNNGDSSQDSFTGFSGDMSFANLNDYNELSGGNMHGLSPEQFLTPVETKNQDTSSALDNILKQVAQERDCLLPQQPQGTQNIPGMNMPMSQISLPQMRR